jgi:uncharacterized protein (TIGR03083 family)
VNTWLLIEDERLGLADSLGELDADEWRAPSLCRGWSNHYTLAHLVASAQITTGRFLGGMLRNGFRFQQMVEDFNARAAVEDGPDLVARLRTLATVRDHPPGPVAAQLLETVVHGEDIAYGLDRKVGHTEAGLLAAAEYASKEQMFVGCRRRIAGLALRATDVDWSTGQGPEVTGPLVLLTLAMCGRAKALDALSGPGVAILRGRS